MTDTTMPDKTRQATPVMPILFISHGPPTILLMDTPVSSFLKQLGKTIPRPEAILCISAHWEAVKQGAGLRRVQHRQGEGESEGSDVGRCGGRAFSDLLHPVKRASDSLLPPSIERPPRLAVHPRTPGLGDTPVLAKRLRIETRSRR